MQMSSEYKNLLVSFLRIVKYEGFRGLFKGIIPPLVNNVPNVAM
jgi:hypothetical protein